jgi:hypothetical protein
LRAAGAADLGRAAGFAFTFRCALGFSFTFAFGGTFTFTFTLTRTFVFAAGFLPAGFALAVALLFMTGRSSPLLLVPAFLLLLVFGFKAAPFYR